MGWVVNATPRPFYPQETPGTHSKGSWVGPRVGLDGCGNSLPHRDLIPGPPSLLRAPLQWYRRISVRGVRFTYHTPPSSARLRMRGVISLLPHYPSTGTVRSALLAVAQHVRSVKGFTHFEVPLYRISLCFRLPPFIHYFLSFAPFLTSFFLLRYSHSFCFSLYSLTHFFASFFYEILAVSFFAVLCLMNTKLIFLYHAALQQPPAPPCTPHYA
jgi:hypothetical protein